MLSSTITGAILVKYETAFAAVPLLVSFIPMLMDTGGNSGSQSSTMVIRGMALGEIEPSDVLKVLWKEIRVGFMVGFVLAVVNFIRPMIQYPGNTMICVTVVISMFATVVAAKTIGCTPAHRGQGIKAGSGHYGVAHDHHHRGRGESDGIL